MLFIFQKFWFNSFLFSPYFSCALTVLQEVPCRIRRCRLKPFPCSWQKDHFPNLLRIRYQHCYLLLFQLIVLYICLCFIEINVMSFLFLKWEPCLATLLVIASIILYENGYKQNTQLSLLLKAEVKTGVQFIVR